MEGMVKGLFGGGEGDNDEKVSRAKDFAQRYTEGNPAEGYDDNEALEQFNSVIGNANSDEVERATRATLQNMPESDRSQFGEFVGQLQQRERGGSGGGSAGVDDISRMFGERGGKANNADDMFGGLFGGGSGGSGGGGGLGGMLGGLMGGGSSQSGSGGGGGLGGLRGGGGSSQGGSGGGLGGILGGNLGKMIMGGIAAYLIKDKLK